MLASEMMAPLVRLIIKRLSDEQIITPIPDEVKLIISTGLSALGRNSDLERLQAFMGLAMQANPEVAAGLIDWDKAMRELETSVGVDLLKSPEALQQEQMMQQQAMEQQAQQAQEQQGMDQATQMAELMGKLPTPPEQEPQPQN